MEIQKIPYESVPFISKIDLAYLQHDSNLKPFYQYEPKIESFAEVIAARRSISCDRELLVRVIRNQYESRDNSPVSKENIDSLLESDTFTVITAHQPSLMTGPLYYIYKICSCINLARKLSTHYGIKVIPVFVTGGEDHDFEEINHFQMYGKTISWEREHHAEPCGRLDLEGVNKVISETLDVLGDQPGSQEIKNILENAFVEGISYGEAMIRLTDQLFGQFGLIIVSMDNAELKIKFRSIMLDEVLQNPSQQYIRETQTKLESVGFKAQAYAREINLFYFYQGQRLRIEENKNGFHIVGSDLYFSQTELIREIHDHPENFSPNVIMRPLFQELIFPNLAYIGGGGELAYWLERKSQFKHFDIPFPVLVRRNSVLLINPGTNKNFKKTGIPIQNYFTPDIECFISKYISKEFTISLADEKEMIIHAFEKIREFAATIDTSLVKVVKAESTKSQNSIDMLAKRLVKSEKNNHEILINRIRKNYQKIFPRNKLQEREENFLPYYQKMGNEFIQDLIVNLDPLEHYFVIAFTE